MINIDFFLKPKELIINKSCSNTLSMTDVRVANKKLKEAKGYRLKKFQ